MISVLKKRTMGILLALLILAISACSTDSEPLNSDNATTARYRLTFKSNWNALDFPTNFPVNRHFSDLIGVVHREGAHIWEVGQTASTGIENVAELGVNTELEGEINSGTGMAGEGELVSGGGIPVDQDSVVLTFNITVDYPCISLISMVAPSPDWFVGVENLSLRKDGDWIERMAVDLPVYDAGTDDGATFVAPNSDSNPPGTIALLSSDAADTDFQNGVHRNEPTLHIASFVFERIDN
ncbi:MAG TPA: spondin domain-containing protein [Calditrichia bacterium]|nr:spondin domain-containing protein [Calditrichia bacterium]HQU70999.1 spondin domain-containing protein [Calditrichia bacterium]